MTASIKLDTLNPVCDTWDLVKRRPNWEEEFGMRLFNKLFKLAPLSLSLLFPFGTQGEQMFESQEFRESAKEAASTMDFAVSSLGPDLAILIEQLLEIGVAHDNFCRIRPDHWTVMGKALISALADTLQDDFTTHAQDCWASVFDVVAAAMIEAIKPMKRSSQ